MGPSGTDAGLIRDHFPHERFRGLHECGLCAAKGLRVVEPASSENLVIPGSNEVYAAPGGIIHYISDHSYLPPTVLTTEEQQAMKRTKPLEYSNFVISP